MTNYSDKNAQAVLENVEKRIAILEERKANWNNMSYYERRYLTPLHFDMREVCDELSIFDWWTNKLSLTRLIEMRTFLKTAIELGYTGYVCFKVGVTGCANGMWAHINESENGFSPDGGFMYRSFTPAYLYYDIHFADNDRLSYRKGLEFDAIKSTRQLKQLLAEAV